MTKKKSSGQFGTGNAFSGNKGSWNTIYSVGKEDLPVGDYVVRFWYNYRIDRPDVQALVEQIGEASKPSKWVAEFDVKQSTNIVGDWCLVEMNFTMSDTVEKVNFLLLGNNSQEPYLVDEFLIQQADGPAIYRTDEIDGEPYLIYNNYWLKRNSFAE
jgi:hypothetical protein